jgi:hypothetical protein
MYVTFISFMEKDGPRDQHENMHYLGNIPMETVKKEVQDTSCRGSGGVPQL